jgi:D-alanyl-D-alanine carboxypeptidase (penicillin-binding protein 5/6)
VSTAFDEPGLRRRLSRRQVYRRRRIVVLGGVVVALATLVYLPLTLLAPLRAAAVTVTAPQEAVLPAVALAFPQYGASGIGAVGMDGLLGQSGSTEPRPMASITKLITALVVLESHPLAPGEAGPTATMSGVDVGYYGEYLAQNGTVSNVRAGMAFTERELLELTLVKSANNYTKSLMMWAFGSQDAYLTAAQGWLASHGLDRIVVHEPTGIDPANVGPVDQLVELGRIALEHPVVAEIVATREVGVTNLGVLPNTNALLGVDGVDGIKTGTLDDFGANLLFSADYTVGTSTVTLVGVVLGGPSHDRINSDILAILASTIANFTEVEVVTVDEAFAVYETVWGVDASAIASESATLLVWSAETIETEVVTEDITTGAAGDDAGDVVFRAGDRSVTIDLELAIDVPDPGPWWRLTNPAALF